MSLRFDVVILGGGPAGTSAAISLRQKGYSVAVINKSFFSETQIGETLPPEIINYLNELGINLDLCTDHKPSYRNQSAWGNKILQENNFFLNPFGHGWHLDRMKFDNKMIDCAKKSGAQFFNDSYITKIELDYRSGWIINFLRYDLEQMIVARFAIDATGRSALLARNQGGRRINIDHLIAVATYQEHNSLDASNFTLVESSKNGWWYSADLPSNKIVFAFMTDAFIYKREQLFSGYSLIKNLSDTEYTKGRWNYDVGNNWKVYAANSYLMSKTSGKNWLAVGDAAMAYDPLSSSGILNAIRDGIKAAAFINKSFSDKNYSIRDFSDSVKERFKKYLVQRFMYYNMEKRWENTAFWQIRHKFYGKI